MARTVHQAVQPAARSILESVDLDRSGLCIAPATLASTFLTTSVSPTLSTGSLPSFTFQVTEGSTTRTASGSSPGVRSVSFLSFWLNSLNCKCIFKADLTRTDCLLRITEIKRLHLPIIWICCCDTCPILFPSAWLAACVMLAPVQFLAGTGIWQDATKWLFKVVLPNQYLADPCAFKW